MTFLKNTYFLPLIRLLSFIQYCIRYLYYCPSHRVISCIPPAASSARYVCLGYPLLEIIRFSKEIWFPIKNLQWPNDGQNSAKTKTISVGCRGWFYYLIWHRQNHTSYRYRTHTYGMSHSCNLCSWCISIYTIIHKQRNDAFFSGNGIVMLIFWNITFCIWKSIII